MDILLFIPKAQLHAISSARACVKPLNNTFNSATFHTNVVVLYCDIMASPDSGNQATSPASAPWRNMWYEILVEELGEEETKRRIANQFHFPAPGWGSWLWLQLQVCKLKIIMSVIAKKTKKRPAHPDGVGASGTAKVLDTCPIVAKFFTPGRMFQARMRHASFANDDGGFDGRSASFHLNDAVNGDILDLIMLTGRMNPFQNIPTFFELISVARETNEDVIRNVVFKRPVYLQGMIDSSRRTPESFTRVNYYALLTYVMVFDDGSKRPVRFRLIPEDSLNKVESGLATEDDQRRAWDRTRRKDETRSTTYLRDAYKEEVEKRNIKYFLEIQVHDGTVPGEPEVFNSGVAWDESKYPWQNLMEIVITTPMSDDECEKLCLNIKNRPDCLEFPQPESVWDYNSIAYVRERAYSASQAQRLN